MSWTKYQRVISDPKTRSSLADILDILKKNRLTISQARCILDLAFACLNTELVTNPTLPTPEDIEVEHNGRMIPGQFVKDHLL